MGSERRVHPRSPVTLLVEYPGIDELAEDYTSNLSIGGTFVYTDKNFAVGTSVDMVLSFPGLLRPIRLTGIVKWSGPDPSGETSGVGVEFTGFDDVARDRIRTVLEAIKSGDERFIAKTTFRLLLIEDNPHLANLMASGLVQFGATQELHFTVDTCRNGAEALDEISHDESDDYDALIVDLYTPIMSGSDFISAVRARGGVWESKPIIAVSGESSDAAEVARGVGSNAFLAKPFRLRDLLQALSGLVSSIPSPVD